MKNLLSNSIFILLFTILTFTSCSKDDDITGDPVITGRVMGKPGVGLEIELRGKNLTQKDILLYSITSGGSPTKIISITNHPDTNKEQYLKFKILPETRAGDVYFHFKDVSIYIGNFEEIIY